MTEHDNWVCVNCILSNTEEGVKFTEYGRNQHWFYISEKLPSLDMTQSITIKGRILIKNINVYGVRIRIEVGGKVRDVWVHFNHELENSSNKYKHSDSGFTVWFASNNLVLVDFHLRGFKGENISIGVMTFNENGSLEFEAQDSEFIIQKIDYSYLVENVTTPVIKNQHSYDFSGRAVELCKGVGVEIGALHCPMPLDAHVIYVDRFKTSYLLKQYAHDERVSTIQQVHVAWKDNFYPFFDDNAFNFVVNSHVLEHVANPARQIEEWLRIIQTEGILYMIVPDKNFCFDRKRHLTSVEHLLDEYETNVSEITIEHYEDYIVNKERSEQEYKTCDTSSESIKKCWEAQGSIHVHTFDPDSLKIFLLELANRFSAELIYFEPKGLNMHCALKKN